MSNTRPAFRSNYTTRATGNAKNNAGGGSFVDKRALEAKRLLDNKSDPHLVASTCGFPSVRAMYVAVSMIRPDKKAAPQPGTQSAPLTPQKPIKTEPSQAAHPPQKAEEVKPYYPFKTAADRALDERKPISINHFTNNTVEIKHSPLHKTIRIKPIHDIHYAEFHEDQIDLLIQSLTFIKQAYINGK